MTLRVGIDLGGTSAKIALVDERKKIRKEASLPTNGFPSALDMSKKLAEIVRQLLNGQKVKRVGVGVAGDIDFKNGVVRISPNLGWKKVPLKAFLEKALHCSVIVDNDANTAAWGVYQTQVPAKVKDVIVVTLGTGVGGGLILNGQLHRGITGSAGELGHMILDEQGRRCNCGQWGCLETQVGGIHLVKMAQEELARGKDSILQGLFRSDFNSLSPKMIADAALKKDRFAQSLWHEAGRRLGVALGDLIYVLNPEMIFLTGGVSQANSLILKPLRETLKKRPFQTPVRAVTIRVAKDPAHMGVIGASLL